MVSFFFSSPPPSLDGNIDFTKIKGTQIFWAFFHSFLAPMIEIGAIWSLKGIDVLNPLRILFFNTFILLSFGATITWNCHVILARPKRMFTF
jgi:heme/copper-type cytochrome/quinol oxidase subunit 3